MLPRRSFVERHMSAVHVGKMVGNPTARQILENSFALAVTVFQNCIAQLSKDDRQDVLTLIPAVIGGNAEERQSAAEAIEEILRQAEPRILSLEEMECDDGGLANWTQFVSKRIRDARKKAGLTQEELAEKAGLPQSHISRLEQQKHSPTAKTLEKIAKALGIPHSELDPSA